MQSLKELMRLTKEIKQNGPGTKKNIISDSAFKAAMTSFISGRETGY